MSDPYFTTTPTPTSFGRRGRLVSPGATDLDPIPKTIVLPVGGNVTIVPVNNTNDATISFTGLPAGATVPYQVRRVTAASAAVWTVED